MPLGPLQKVSYIMAGKYPRNDFEKDGFSVVGGM